MWTVLLGFCVLGIGAGAGAAYVQTHKNIIHVHMFNSKTTSTQLSRNLAIDVAGNTKCPHCEVELTPENIGIIVEKNSCYYEICDKSMCMESSTNFELT